jgi:hypothetical protein
MTAMEIKLRERYEKNIRQEASGTSGSTKCVSSIWPVSYCFDIIIALTYIVLGTGPNCQPAPVPGLLSKKTFLQLESHDGVAWLLRNSASSFDPPVSECVLSMVQICCL